METLNLEIAVVLDDVMAAYLVGRYGSLGDAKEKLEEEYADEIEVTIRNATQGE